MEFIRGDTIKLKFQRKYVGGDIITEKADNVFFTVKRSVYCKDYLIQKSLSKNTIIYDEEDNFYYMTIHPKETENLEYEDYVFDIEITDHNEVRTIAKGILSITSEVTYECNKEVLVDNQEEVIMEEVEKEIAVLEETPGNNNYNYLDNIPTINNIEVKGNLTAEDLNLQSKEEGKGLSTNDFTNDYKEKLEKLENYSLPTASKDQLGGVKIGEGLSATKDGTVSFDKEVIPEETDPTVPDYVKAISEEDIEKWNKDYTLPIASPEILGGVKIGEGVNVSEDGTISVESGSGGNGIIVLEGTDEEPIELYKVIEPGIYLINGPYMETKINGPYSTMDKSIMIVSPDNNSSIIGQLVFTVNGGFKCHCRPTLSNEFTARFEDFREAEVISMWDSGYVTSRFLYNYLGGNKLEDLSTDDKTSLVNAINEVNSKIDALKGQ